MGVTEETLARMRRQKRSPSYFKVLGRIIYMRDDLSLAGQAARCGLKRQRRPRGTAAIPAHARPASPCAVSIVTPICIVFARPRSMGTCCGKFSNHENWTADEVEAFAATYAKRGAHAPPDVAALVARQGADRHQRQDALNEWQAMVCRLEAKGARFAPAVMMVGTRLKMLSIAHGFCWATNAALAAELGLGPRSVEMAVAALKARGAIVISSPQALADTPALARRAQRWLVPNVGFQSTGQPGPLASVMDQLTKGVLACSPDLAELRVLVALVDRIIEAGIDGPASEMLDTICEVWARHRGRVFGADAPVADTAIYAASHMQPSVGDTAQNAVSGEAMPHNLRYDTAQNAVSAGADIKRTRARLV